jgi:hypothetical protein
MEGVLAAFQVRIFVFFAAVSAALALFVPSAGKAEPGPFSGLAGSWSGSGTVALAGGPRERIRCRAHYTVGGGGNSLQQSLRCASDSYRFDLSSNVRAQGGQISGNWSESSRNIQGVLFGQAQPGRIYVNVTGPGFAANLSLATHGDRQSVTINSAGAQPAGASITLSRSK